MASLQECVQAAYSQCPSDIPGWMIESPPPVAPPSREELRRITQRAIDIYMLSKQANGEMGGIGWWQSANGYTAMALHDLWSAPAAPTAGEKSRNYPALALALRQCESRHPNFVNVFNDDTLWWALCCVHVYRLGGDDWFLERARAVWRHVRRFVCRPGQASFRGVDMEGGCFWKSDGHPQINAISTGLFAELSVRLALLSRGDGHGDLLAERLHLAQHPHLSALLGHQMNATREYLEAARRSLGWLLRCRYWPHEGIVLDHIDIQRQEAVDWTFTYNTGVVMGVCALLYEATNEEPYLALACFMANKAMRRKGWVEENGVLTEHGAYGRGNHDPWKNDDAVGFKAVLLRHLGTLYDVIHRTGVASDMARGTAALIKRFIITNFRSLQERGTNGNGQYGPWWNGPFEAPTSHSQLPALDVMAAVMLVNRE